MRLQSTRLHRKALAPIAGSSLLEHVVRAAVRADVGPVVVATDSTEIVERVTRAGFEAVLTGPAANGTLRVAQAAGDADIVLNVQGDQPLLDPAHVRALASCMQRCAIGTVVTPYDADPDDPSVVQAIVEDGFAVDFCRRPHAPVRWRHLGLYGFSRDALNMVSGLGVSARAQTEGLEQLTWLDAGLQIRVVEVERAEPAVDTPEQLEQVRRHLADRTTTGG